MVSALRSAQVYWTVQPKNPNNNQGSTEGISIALCSLSLSIHSSHNHSSTTERALGILANPFRDSVLVDFPASNIN